MAVDRASRTLAAMPAATARALTAPWTVVQQWRDVMQGWLGDDWHERAVSWLVAKPLALVVVPLGDSGQSAPVTDVS